MVVRGICIIILTHAFTMRSKVDITAIIYDKHGRALSIGKNSYTKTHPIMLKYANKVGRPHKVYLHAEVDAILKCKNLDRAYKICVYRYDSKGNPLPAQPCPICMSVIELTPIKIIEHT